MRRLAGILAGLIGITGIVLSALGIAYLLKATRWLDRNLPGRLSDVEQTLALLSQQTHATTSNLTLLRGQLGVMRTVLQELAQEEKDRPMTNSLKQSLEKTVVGPLREAEELMLSSQESMRNLGGALLVMDSIPLFSLAKASPENEGERPLKSIANRLAETADLLQQALEAVSDIRTGQKLSAEQLARPLDALAEVDGKLERFQAEAQQLALKLENAQASVALGRDKTSSWLNRGRGAGVLFFICFGFTQVSLLLQGWALVTHRGRGVDAATLDQPPNEPLVR